MKIILLKDVPKVGRKYDVKNIADGYAMNFLIPQKLAEYATPEKIKNLEMKKMQDSEEKKIQENILMKNIKALNGVSIEMKEKTNEKGHLFKGIHKEEIAKALKEQKHIDLKPEHIQLEHPIKEAGEFDITVKVDKSKVVFKLVINNIT